MTESTELPEPIAPNVPAGDLDAHVKAITELRYVIVRLAQASKSRTLNPREEPDLTPLAKIDGLLSWLDSEIVITPELKRKAQLEQLLVVLGREQKFKFPQHHHDKAKAVLEKYEAVAWGVGESNEATEGAIETPAADYGADQERPAKRQRRMSSSTTVTSIRPPPPNHAIFGVDGIMPGVGLKPGLRKVWAIDRSYPQKNAKVYGHNGIDVGSWYPRQLVALFKGAHGSSQGGIAGDVNEGAYSIIVSGQYADLDKDLGDVILYSGPNSHDNRDPRNLAPDAQTNSGARALHASIATGRPVRVLRQSAGESTWAPTRGMRYDGLYEVTSAQRNKNGKGGLYEQFRLRRVAGQKDLGECKRRPTPMELRHYDRIENGY